MRKQTFELILKNKETGEITERIETNCLFVVANVKPSEKGTILTENSLYSFKNVSGEKVLNVLNEAIEYAYQVKEDLVIDSIERQRGRK